MSRIILQQEVFYCLCGQIMYFPRKERQKEHSTDRQTQPRRQTGSRGSLFFRITYKYRQVDIGQAAIEKDFPHFYRTQMQYIFVENAKRIKFA
jgi:hypothetical protein